ncbi:hypothetical protein [Chryseobacterium populi]|uniref:Uncharacterized protein n=1 Tax=Chryseobacterium populi TaxID=1144316 RepID=J3CL52_9FLAO|nr:hypothetical protein [Chryseobacterium populi]EJL73804.1 hypothetical protein PMI13_01377 [Chryseobacterium populi]
MKKLLFTSLLSLGLLLPATISASTNNSTSATEFSAKKPKKGKKNRKSKRSKARKSRSTQSYYSSSRGCTYNGHKLIVGPRGGCYYYSGSSREYVDRSYCSGCR